MLCLETHSFGCSYILISGEVCSPLTAFGALPPGQFHGRAQPSSIQINFLKELALVQEAARLLGAVENQEDDVENCISRLESLSSSNCVNVMPSST